jgi:hypothetical protein
MRQLKAAIRARSFEATDSRLDRFYRTAVRSPENMSAAVRAVQRLRDLEAIDHAEAAYLFNSLYDTASERQDESDPAFDRAIEQGVEWELIWAAMDHDTRTGEIDFLRAHGEEELARLLAERPDEFGLFWAGGCLSLLEDKPRLKELRNPEPGLPVSVVLPERILALSAAVSIREWHAAWDAFHEELRVTDPSGAVAAIQGLREVGTISFEESLALLDMAIDPIVDARLARDREFQRLDRALEAAAKKYAIDYAKPEDSRPMEFRVIDYLRLRRADNLTAVVFREFGEHRIANLITTDPEKFNAMREDLHFSRAR